MLKWKWIESSLSLLITWRKISVFFIAAYLLTGCVPMIGQRPSYEYETIEALQIFYPIFRHPASAFLGYQAAQVPPEGVDHYGLIGVGSGDACPRHYMRDCQNISVDIRIKDFPIAYRQLTAALANPCDLLTRSPEAPNEAEGRQFLRKSELKEYHIRNAITGIRTVFYCDKPIAQRPPVRIYLDLVRDMDAIPELPPANWMVYGKSVKYGAQRQVIERLLVKPE